MGFGLSFGSNKQKVNQTGTVNKTVTGTQQGQTATEQAQTSESQGLTTTSGSTVGQSTTSQTGKTTSATTGTQQQAQRTQSFSDLILQALEGTTASQLARADAQANAVDVSVLGGFNPANFVAGGVNAARSTLQGGLEESINGLTDRVGGTTTGNSSVALLANRLRGDAASQLAGIESSLTGQGEEIQRQNLLAQSQIGASQQSFVNNLLQSLRGGVTTTTGEASTSESGVGTSEQLGQTQTAEQQLQQQATQQSTVSTLVSLLDQLLNTTENTVGTETLKGTTSKKGGGFSLSL